mgnify:CR=1 FL=1
MYYNECLAHNYLHGCEGIKISIAVIILKGLMLRMNKKWLLKEIELWQNENIINADSASALKSRYSQKSGLNTITIIFSVLGSLLIGAGIILIFAKNWYRMPAELKAALSVLPLLTGQGLAIYVVKKKYTSLAWREGVAIFYSAGVFCAIAMVGQSFHIANDYGSYVLICGLLCLPIIYILDAVSPLAVYYYTTINWGAFALQGTEQPVIAFILLALFAVGLVYVVINRKKTTDIRHIYTLWISVVAGFALVIIYSMALDTDVLFMCLMFFLALFAADKNRPDLTFPYKPVAVLGGLVILMILSSGWYFGSYSYLQETAYVKISSSAAAAAAVTMAGSIFFGIRHYKTDKQKLLFPAALLAVGILVLTASYIDIHLMLITVTANIITLIIGIGLIVKGSKDADLPVTNLGLIVTCGLIVMRFFDDYFDFLWRGIAFLILGGIFLMINFVMLKKRKAALKGKEAQQQ